LGAPGDGPVRRAPAIKACRNRLVDDVERLLGVPIIGTSTPLERISAADVAVARLAPGLAIAAVARESAPAGPRVLACRSELRGCRAARRRGRDAS
jgi:hypothetical protein